MVVMNEKLLKLVYEIANSNEGVKVSNIEIRKRIIQIHANKKNTQIERIYILRTTIQTLESDISILKKIYIRRSRKEIDIVVFGIPEKQTELDYFNKNSKLDIQLH